MIGNIALRDGLSRIMAGSMNSASANAPASQSTQPGVDHTGAISSTQGQNVSARVTISEEARNKLEQQKNVKSVQNSDDQTNSRGLTDDELRKVEELKSTDREVRAHEMAHVMAGAGLVRKGASFQYRTGPDGQRYAVSGEVSIDTSPVQDDPAATITKMQHVKRAALAPTDPSAQDRAVASEASKQEAVARRELRQESFENTEIDSGLP